MLTSKWNPDRGFAGFVYRNTAWHIFVLVLVVVLESSGRNTRECSGGHTCRDTVVGLRWRSRGWNWEEVPIRNGNSGKRCCGDGTRGRT